MPRLHPTRQALQQHKKRMRKKSSRRRQSRLMPWLFFGGGLLGAAAIPAGLLGFYHLQGRATALELQPLQPSAQPLSQQVEATVAALPAAAPWPEIHEFARAAQVPVFMYHDILAPKEVFFDVTPEELEADFEFLREQGATPVHLWQLVAHLRTGLPLPEKAVVLSFDDGYGGHYEHVYPLLRKYNFPAVFSIYLDKLKGQTARSSLTWEQLQEMAADPLVTIAAHSVSHPEDLRDLPDADLREEIFASKRVLEEKLGIPIEYFTYPAGRSDDRVERLTAEAGFRAALSMDDYGEDFANASRDLLVVSRFGQSSLERVAPKAWGGDPPPRTDGGFDFSTTVRRTKHRLGRRRGAILITGGRPTTVHADSRYQLEDVIADTEAIAAVDGGFFNLRFLDSNQMIGPVLSQHGADPGAFVPGQRGEIPLLDGRPLVLIGPDAAAFVPFDHTKHNTLAGVRAELPEVTDAFVGAAWLVKAGRAQERSTFRDLYGFDAYRFRAFWGFNWSGQPVVGVSTSPIDSVALGRMLQELGLRDAVMLDSGASTSLVYEGTSQVGYTPRPVPHAVALFAPDRPSKIGLGSEFVVPEPAETLPQFSAFETP